MNDIQKDMSRRIESSGAAAQIGETQVLYLTEWVRLALSHIQINVYGQYVVWHLDYI